MNNLYQTGVQIGDVFTLGINSAFFEQPRNIIKDSFCFKDTLEDNFRNFDTSSSSETWINPISSTIGNTRIFETNTDDKFKVISDSPQNDMYAEKLSDSHAEDIYNKQKSEDAEDLEKTEKSEEKKKTGNSEKSEEMSENVNMKTNDVKPETAQIAQEPVQAKEEKNAKTTSGTSENLAENVTKNVKNSTSLLERLLKISGKHENEESKKAGNSSEKNNVKTKSEQNVRHTENENVKSSAMAENGEIRKTAKNEEKNDAKAAETKTDLSSRLENETGVKINKLTYESNSNTENGADGKSRGEAEMGLLKNLANSNTRPTVKQESLEDADHQDSRASFKDLTQEVKSNSKTESSAARPGNTIDAKVRSELNEAGTSKSSNNNTNNEKFLQQQDSAGNTQNASAKSALSAQQQTSTSATASNILLLQEIMGKIQSTVKSDSFDANPKLSMDFESSTLGQMHMSIHQKGSTLNVSLETSSDSTKDNLMGQRDELARQMKNLGYSEVNVDISSSGEKKENSSGKQQFRGNADIDNVKLAGNDKIGLPGILAF